MFHSKAAISISFANGKYIYNEFENGDFMNRKNVTSPSSRVHILDAPQTALSLGKTAFTALKGFVDNVELKKSNNHKAVIKASGLKSQKEFYVCAKEVSIFYRNGQLTVCPTDSEGKGFFGFEHLPNYGKIIVPELTEEALGQVILQAMQISRNKEERDRDLAQGKK